MISYEILSRLWEKVCFVGIDLNLFLLDYRNILIEGVGSFFVQRLFGWRIKILFLIFLRLFVFGLVYGVFYKLKERKVKQVYYYDRGVKELNRLKFGDVVCVKLRFNLKEWIRVVVDKEVDIRLLEDGCIYRRN